MYANTHESTNTLCIAVLLFIHQHVACIVCSVFKCWCCMLYFVTTCSGFGILGLTGNVLLSIYILLHEYKLSKAREALLEAKTEKMMAATELESVKVSHSVTAPTTESTSCSSTSKTCPPPLQFTFHSYLSSHLSFVLFLLFLSALDVTHLQLLSSRLFHLRVLNAPVSSAFRMRLLAASLSTSGVFNVMNLAVTVKIHTQLGNHLS